MKNIKNKRGDDFPLSCKIIVCKCKQCKHAKNKHKNRKLKRKINRLLNKKRRNNSGIDVFYWA